MSLRVLIVDAESFARGRLEKLLAAEPDVEVAATVVNAAEALAAIDKLAPDLVFLDADLPGIDWAAVRSRAGLTPEVVFTAATDRHALRAFDARAVDYLLKPFDGARVAESLRRIRERSRWPSRSMVLDHMRHLLAEVGRARRDDETAPRPLIVKRGEQSILLDPAQVDWFESDDKYVNVHTGKQVYLRRDTLGRLEAALDARQFVRIHRSRIVNLVQVRELRPLGRGDYEAVMRCGTRLLVGRAYLKRLAAVMESAI